MRLRAWTTHRNGETEKEAPQSCRPVRRRAVEELQVPAQGASCTNPSFLYRPALSLSFEGGWMKSLGSQRGTRGGG